MENFSSSTNGHGHRAAAMPRRFGMQLSSFLPSSLSSLLEVSGVMRSRLHYQEPDSSSAGGSGSSIREREAEVSIRIIGESEHSRSMVHGEEDGAPQSSASPLDSPTSYQTNSELNPLATSGGEDNAEISNAAGLDARELVSQRYDFQQLGRWIEQVLPFTILLLVVFVRQHLQGFFVTLWISTLMIKANDILRKQTALRGERKSYVLIGVAVVLLSHIIGIYWWYHADSLWRPLILLPPKEIPSFPQAIFIIVLNDTMVRQSSMVFKCGLLLYYKKGRGRNYRWQGQLLTLTEYVVLLYRTVIPGSVWYRFFLNKEYGSFFSSLTTGLYLTFKVTSIFEKVQKFVAAIRSLLRREVQYGTYATSEEVMSAGDLCAICQEKMHAPITLRCKHVFCEDCVSEWFERERTCPLCRSIVKSSDLRSFGDGSTSLFIQLF